MLYDVAALTAAFSVAMSNIISPPAIRHLGQASRRPFKVVQPIVHVHDVDRALTKQQPLDVRDDRQDR